MKTMHQNTRNHRFKRITCIGLLGLACAAARADTPPATMQGVDLAPLYLGDAMPPWREEFFYSHPTISHKHRIPTSQAVVREDMKYVYWPEWEHEQLFDLTQDPTEKHNLVENSAYAEQLESYRARLDAWLKWARAPEKSAERPFGPASTSSTSSTGSSGSTGITAEAASERPNVLFLLSDDQAWGDYGFMGHPHIETPVIDRLADESLTYTRGYTPVPLCHPSLTSIVTGLHGHEHGITGNDPLGPRSQRGKRYQPMLEDFQKLPNMIRSLTSAGYRTLQTGKWWEGNPVEHGGFTHGMTHGDPQRGGRHGDKGLEISRKTLQPIKDFVRESGEQPWFIWYGVFLPHTPHNPPQDLLDKYLPVAPSPAVARYWANCEWLDRSIGEILEFLEDTGELDNTLIVYTCDNGWIQDPARPQRFAERSKRTAYEGGVRTPIMLAWPDKIDPLMDRTHLASNLDLWPTIAQLTGSDYPQHLTGIDLTDRQAVTQRDTIYGASYQHDMQDYGNPAASLKKRFVIQNFWKLLQPHQANQAPELYDLKADPRERQNLAGQQPEVVNELTEKMNLWWTPE